MFEYVKENDPFAFSLFEEDFSPNPSKRDLEKLVEVVIIPYLSSKKNVRENAVQELL